MRVNLRTIAVSALLSAGFICATVIASNTSQTDFRLLPTSSSLDAYKQAAYEGSGVAANSLSTYYMKADASGRLERYWTSISAENGDSVGQYNLAHYYLDRRNPDRSAIRARFWLNKSAAQGNEMAQERLTEPLKFE